MTLLGHKIAELRSLLEGVLQAPPAMHATIMEWILAVIAASKLEGAEEDLARIQSQAADFSKLLASARTFQADPTWKNYVPVYDGSWVFGHPGARWSVKDFQKMTPEKRAELDRRAALLLKRVEVRVEESKKLYADNVQHAVMELQKAKTGMRPGVGQMVGGEATRVFPVDVTGWRYDTSTLQQQIDAMKGKEKADSQAVYDQMVAYGKMDPAMLDNVLKLAQNGPEYPNITVLLTTKPSKHSGGSWNQFARLLTLIVPEPASVYSTTIKALERALLHELRHMAQSYLAYALGKAFENSTRRPGLPSRKFQTPEYRQEYDPKRPDFNPKNPTLIRVYQTLKAQGVNVSAVDWHALDDIEFYTRLADTIGDFKGLWDAHGSPEILNQAIQLWTGAVQMPPDADPRDVKNYEKGIERLGGLSVLRWFKADPFFRALRDRAPAKWRKAVSEFVKAVS